jgi:hypothetical protein
MNGSTKMDSSVIKITQGGVFASLVPFQIQNFSRKPIAKQQGGILGSGREKIKMARGVSDANTFKNFTSLSVDGVFVNLSHRGIRNTSWSRK